MKIKGDALYRLAQNANYLVTVEVLRTNSPERALFGDEKTIDFDAKKEHLPTKFYVYDKKTFELRTTIDVPFPSIQHIYISPDSKYIMAYETITLHIWRLVDESGTVDTLRYKYYRKYLHLTHYICHHENTIATLHIGESKDIRLHFYDLETGHLQAKSKHRYGKDTHFYMSPNGLVAVRNFNGIYVLAPSVVAPPNKLDYSNLRTFRLGVPTIMGYIEVGWIGDALLIRGAVPFYFHRNDNQPALKDSIHVFDFRRQISDSKIYEHYTINLEENIKGVQYTHLARLVSDNGSFEPVLYRLQLNHFVNTEMIRVIDIKDKKVQILKSKLMHGKRKYVNFDENHFLALGPGSDSIEVCDYFTPKERLEQILLYGLDSSNPPACLDSSNPPACLDSSNPPAVFHNFLTRGLYDPRLFLFIGAYLG